MKYNKALLDLVPKLISSPAPREVANCDFTIVIPHRGPIMGLWLTIETCINELRGTDWNYNFIIVCNGEEQTPEHKKIRHYLEATRYFRDWIHVNEPMSPPSARNLGADSATGKNLYFFDNHCIPAKGYFERAQAALARPDVDVIHSTIAYYTGFDLSYHYRLRLGFNFWGVGVFTPIDPENPYKCSVNGHGGFAVKRDVFKESLGYWGGFVGYGGEESYFNLKMWLLGKQVWADPKMIHYHFAGDRGYPRHHGADYYSNMFAAANIIGGQAWMNKLHDSFLQQPMARGRDGKPVPPLYDLMEAAYERSQPRAEWLAQRRTQTLDELLEWFKQNGVAH